MHIWDTFFFFNTSFIWQYRIIFFLVSSCSPRGPGGSNTSEHNKCFKLWNRTVPPYFCWTLHYCHQSMELSLSWWQNTCLGLGHVKQLGAHKQKQVCVCVCVCVCVSVYVCACVCFHACVRASMCVFYASNDSHLINAHRQKCKTCHKMFHQFVRRALLQCTQISAKFLSIWEKIC